MPRSSPQDPGRTGADRATRPAASDVSSRDGRAETDAIVRRFEARDSRAGRGYLARGHRYLAEERHTAMRELIGRELPGIRHPLILDVGCGGGYDLAKWLADGWPPEALTGIDLVPGRIEAARLAVPGADLRVGDGPELPYPEASFDVATAATVFSSIAEPATRERLFSEMSRVVRPGGLVIVYDFVVRNPRNRSVRAMVPTLLARMAARPPDGSSRLGPFLYAVGPALAIHPVLGRLAARIMPRTHALSYWRV